MDDPEHMNEMMKRVEKAGGSAPKPLPPLATWSAEVDALADVNDTLLLVRDTLIRANVAKEKQSNVPPIKWTPRPGRRDVDADMPGKMSREEIQARHQRAVALFLPPKETQDD